MSITAGEQTASRLPRATVGLSVALCTWNGAAWLPQFLESLAAQERLPDELVIQDDASDDATIAVATAFAAEAPFEVRIEINEVRVGSTANFELALRRCHGHFIALADQDDVWYPEKLRVLVHELELDPTVTMVLSDADLIDETGRPIGRRLWQTRLVERTLRNHAVVSGKLFAHRALTTGCTVVLRRRALEAAIPFPPILADPVAPMRHDRWLSLVAAAVGTVRSIPEPLLGFRIHPEQETGVLVRRQLSVALARAALGVARDDPSRPVEWHRVRAAQLEVAAERADLVGDFDSAAMLRQVAEHQRHRTLDAGTLAGRVRLVAGGFRAGEYGYSPMDLGAALADLVRAARPRRGGSG